MKCYHYCIDILNFNKNSIKKSGLFYYTRCIENDTDYYNFLLFLRNKYQVVLSDDSFIINSLTLLNP